MFAAILVWALLPWLDTSRVRSANFRPILRQLFWILMVVVVHSRLSGCSRRRTSNFDLLTARSCRSRSCSCRSSCTFYYFVHFLVIMPVVGLMETPHAGARKHLEGGVGEERRIGQACRRRRAAESACRERTDENSELFLPFCFAIGFAGIALGRRTHAAKHPEHQSVELGRRVRHVRPAAAAARVSGLQGSLRGLPRHALCCVPQSVAAGRTGVQRSPGEGDRGRLQVPRARRQGRSRSSAAARPPTVFRRRLRTRSPRVRRTTTRFRRTFRSSSRRVTPGPTTSTRCSPVIRRRRQASVCCRG